MHYNHIIVDIKINLLHRSNNYKSNEDNNILLQINSTYKF